MSEQHEEESLRRWAREQAEIERQTDALVLRTLTAMVTAAEDLKSKLRRDTESMLEEYRKTKRGLENEIGLSTAERQRFRRELEQERETLISEASAQAKKIVEDAEREREQLLRETRTMEQRLRSIEGQIRSLFGQQGAAIEAAADGKDTPAAPVAISPAAPARGFASSTFTRSTASGAATPSFTPPVAPAATPPTASVTPAPSPIPTPAPAPDEDDVAESALVVEDEAELIDEDEAEDEATVSAAPPVFTPAPRPPVISVPPPAPAFTPAPAPRPAASTERRLVELVFDGVPGYQQASALERAIDDLVPDGEVDIVDFERGQLVLNVQVADLEALADQLVATSPASLQLESIDGDRATFHCS